jgi:hypothetical protein
MKTPNTTGALKREANSSPIRGIAFVSNGPVPPQHDFLSGPANPVAANNRKRRTDSSVQKRIEQGN